MCQITVLLDSNGRQETIMENVTALEVTPEGVSVRSLFEEPRLVSGARVRRIDFLGGAVTLVTPDKEE